MFEYSTKLKRDRDALIEKVRELANIIGGMEAGTIAHPAGNTVEKAYELIKQAEEES